MVTMCAPRWVPIVVAGQKSNGNASEERQGILLNEQSKTAEKQKKRRACVGAAGEFKITNWRRRLSDRRGAYPIDEGRTWGQTLTLTPV
jgi:hypothetical protein